MSKWPHVSQERKQAIFAYNREKAAHKEAANDLYTLLGALPPGQAKNLLKDEICGAILRKYGISVTEEEESEWRS